VETPEERAIQIFVNRPKRIPAACCCIGAYDNEPVCACAMNWVVTVDDNFYEIIEHQVHDGVEYSAQLLGPTYIDWSAKRAEEWANKCKALQAAPAPTLQERLMLFKRTGKVDAVKSGYPNINARSEQLQTFGNLDEKPIGEMNGA
jgi:hypothetical protein